jgi:NAD(P)-dependent dehydrogenase (short-subunit alcohol dehydrogenase family)
MDPAGKVAVVTGGNSGLGEGAALRLASLGATVVTLDRAGQAPAGASTIPCDVSDPASVKAAVDQVVTRHGAIHILLNNAGIGGVGPIASAEGPAT